MSITFLNVNPDGPVFNWFGGNQMLSWTESNIPFSHKYKIQKKNNNGTFEDTTIIIDNYGNLYDPFYNNQLYYTFNNPDVGVYKLIVTDSVGNNSSPEISKVFIIITPGNIGTVTGPTTPVATDTEFTLTFTSSELIAAPSDYTYQWRRGIKNDLSIPTILTGATTNTYTGTAPDINIYTYYLEVYMYGAYQIGIVSFDVTCDPVGSGGGGGSNSVTFTLSGPTSSESVSVGQQFTLVVTPPNLSPGNTVTYYWFKAIPAPGVPIEQQGPLNSFTATLSTAGSQLYVCDVVILNSGGQLVLTPPPRFEVTVTATGGGGGGTPTQTFDITAASNTSGSVSVGETFILSAASGLATYTFTKDGVTLQSGPSNTYTTSVSSVGTYIYVMNGVNNFGTSIGPNIITITVTDGGGGGTPSTFTLTETPSTETPSTGTVTTGQEFTLVVPPPTLNLGQYVTFNWFKGALGPDALLQQEGTSNTFTTTLSVAGEQIFSCDMIVRNFDDNTYLYSIQFQITITATGGGGGTPTTFNLTEPTATGTVISNENFTLSMPTGASSYIWFKDSSNSGNELPLSPGSSLYTNTYTTSLLAESQVYIGIAIQNGSSTTYSITITATTADGAPTFDMSKTTSAAIASNSALMLAYPPTAGYTYQWRRRAPGDDTSQPPTILTGETSNTFSNSFEDPGTYLMYLEQYNGVSLVGLPIEFILNVYHIPSIFDTTLPNGAPVITSISIPNFFRVAVDIIGIDTNTYEYSLWENDTQRVFTIDTINSIYYVSETGGSTPYAAGTYTYKVGIALKSAPSTILGYSAPITYTIQEGGGSTQKRFTIQLTPPTTSVMYVTPVTYSPSITWAVFEDPSIPTGLQVLPTDYYFYIEKQNSQGGYDRLSPGILNTQTPFGTQLTLGTFAATVGSYRIVASYPDGVQITGIGIAEFTIVNDNRLSQLSAIVPTNITYGNIVNLAVPVTFTFSRIPLAAKYILYDAGQTPQVELAHVEASLAEAQMLVYQGTPYTNKEVYLVATNADQTDFTPYQSSPIMLDIPCLPRGTPVLTPTGYRLVEDFADGDLVVTEDGRSVPVKVHRSSTTCSDAKSAPVRIAAQSFFGAYPVAPIRVSPWHAFKVGGRTENAWMLPKDVIGVDGVVQEPFGQTVEYYHFELPDYLHDNLVLEGGAVVESYGIPWKQAAGLWGKATYVMDKAAGYCRRIEQN